MVRDGKANTAKIGGLRFVNIHGESVLRYPAAAAALDYGVTVEVQLPDWKRADGGCRRPRKHIYLCEIGS